MVPLVALLLLALVVFVLWAVYRAFNPGYSPGRVIAVDSRTGGGSSVGRVPRMFSRRYGLSGTPDELRTNGGGTVVPVEIKSSRGPTPGASPHASHRIQLLAYCLLVEERTGVSPPYGLLIYQDGAPRKVPWGPSEREEVISWIERARQPYRWEADPSPAKCSHCQYRRQCDRAM